MFGFISKRAHDAAIEALTATHEAEIKILADARDHLVRSLNELETSLANSRARVARLEIDNKRLADEAEANARFVKVGKARLDALARQNARVREQRRAGA